MRSFVMVCAWAAAAVFAWPQGPPTGQAPAQKKAAQKKAPAPPYQLTADEKQQIDSKAEQLAAQINSLRARHVDETLLNDVEIYRSAVRMILEHPEEFYTQAYVGQTLADLDAGLDRARQLADGKSPWTSQK